MWIPKIFKTKYILVKTLEVDNVIREDAFGNTIEKGSLYFYLYESKKRDRKIEWKKTITINDNFDRIGCYTKKIYPWLNGMDFDDIPSYWEAVVVKKKSKVRGLYKLILAND